MNNAFQIVSGVFRETIFDGFVRNAGEGYSTVTTPATNALGQSTSVVLTENRVQSPTFSTRETPFTASTLPGKPYRIRLNTAQPDAFLEITCSPE